MLLIVMKVELEEMCYLGVLVFMEMYVRGPIILNNVYTVGFVNKLCRKEILHTFICGYSSVVELPIADRRVPSSNLGAPYIVSFQRS